MCTNEFKRTNERIARLKREDRSWKSSDNQRAGEAETMARKVVRPDDYSSTRDGDMRQWLAFCRNVVEEIKKPEPVVTGGGGTPKNGSTDRGSSTSRGRGELNARGDRGRKGSDPRRRADGQGGAASRRSANSKWMEPLSKKRQQDRRRDRRNERAWSSDRDRRNDRDRSREHRGDRDRRRNNTRR
uniref:Uncharacterized protein n=1 Tax=Lotharella oceanica TaxID=641309 RepID=A0A7S2TXQ8_9EUKA